MVELSRGKVAIATFSFLAACAVLLLLSGSLPSAPAREKLQVDRSQLSSTFHIAPCPLRDALLAWADQAGVMIVIVDADTPKMQAPSVQGALRNEEALRRILTGSSVGFEFVGNGSGVRLFPIDADGHEMRSDPQEPTRRTR